MKEKYNKKDFKFIRLNWIFIGFILLSLASNLEQYFLTRLIERFSRIVSYNDGTLIRSTILFFILWAVIFFALRISRSRLKARISYLWNIRVKKELMENILTRDPVYFESKDKASYISLFNNDLKFIEENYLFSVDWIISNLVLLLVCLAYGFTINIEITMIIFVFGIIVMLISKFISSLSSNENEKYMKSLNSYNEILNDGFYGYKTLLSFNKTGHFLRKFGHRTKDNEKIHEKSLFLNSSRISVINISSMILQTFLMLLSALFVYWGKIEAFYFPVLLSLMNIIIWPMQEIADSYGNIISTRKIRERILKDFAFDEEEFPDKPRIHKEIAGNNSDIYFDKVDFSYGSKEILEKASFLIHNKNHVIISGASGTGDSDIMMTDTINPLKSKFKGFHKTFKQDDLGLSLSSFLLN